MDTKKITELIEWARKYWPSEGYLLISELPSGYPFDPSDLFDENRDELSLFLESELLQHPGEIAIKFTSIFIPFTCSDTHFKHELPNSTESPEEYVRSEFRKLLSYFVGLLRVEDCTDWKRTQWEILNCYAGQNWSLAEELYDRAAQLQLCVRIDLLFLRAQFDFLLVFGREMTADFLPPNDRETSHLTLTLDSLLWPPMLLTALAEDESSAKLAPCSLPRPLPRRRFAPGIDSASLGSTLAFMVSGRLQALVDT